MVLTTRDPITYVDYLTDSERLAWWWSYYPTHAPERGPEPAGLLGWMYEDDAT